MFTYLGWTLDKSDNDWPEVFRNIRKTQHAIVYRVVVQAVLLFGSEARVLLA